MDFLLEFYSFLRTRKKLWLLPLLLIMAAIGAFLLVGSHAAIAPFIYTIF